MQNDPPIAVVAISGVFPGATGLEQFWSNIRGKFDATNDVPKNRWNVYPDSFLRSSGTPDKAYTKRACLISN
ncbi:MAG: hypothetical protein HZB24_09955, partial [Desulfobacterales bacterium]|nr:hypothetical protein [Desulfobacterales bacterium]